MSIVIVIVIALYLQYVLKHNVKHNVFIIYAGFGDVQGIIVKVAHAKRKGKNLVSWMMSNLTNEEREILDRDMESSGHRGSNF